MRLLKNSKRTMINSHLRQLKPDYKRIEAIKDVLEYTMKSSKEIISTHLSQLGKDMHTKKYEQSTSMFKSNKIIDALPLSPQSAGVKVSRCRRFKLNVPCCSYECL